MSESYFPSESFLLACIGILSGCCGGFLTFILKSRCTEISCLGLKIKRDVISATDLDKVNVDIENKNNNL